MLTSGHCTRHCRPTFSSSLMMSVGVSALKHTDLHYVDAGVEVNVKFSSCWNFCLTSKSSGITSPFNSSQFLNSLGLGIMCIEDLNVWRPSWNVPTCFGCCTAIQLSFVAGKSFSADSRHEDDLYSFTFCLASFYPHSGIATEGQIIIIIMGSDLYCFSCL